MEKKPVNFVVKTPEQAVKELNLIVEKGGSNFDVGVNPEFVTTVTKNSDGTTEEEKERVYRIIGFVDMMVGQELDSLNAVREEIHAIKKERQEMNRTLNVMNKSAFAPISIFLLIIAVITLAFGILTLANILPLPAGQTPIAIVLTIVGVLALGGSIALFVLRRKKKLALLERKDEILQSDAELQSKEASVELKTPQWYKNALWSNEGSIVKNSKVRLTLIK